MQEIRCPNCQQVFQVDESGYARILKQVRDKEYQKDLERLQGEFLQKKESDLTIQKMELEKVHRDELAKLEHDLVESKRSIEQLKSEIDGKETEKKLAITEVLQEKERELSELRAKVAGSESEKELALSRLSQVKEKELSEKQYEISELKGKLQNKDSESELKEKTLREQFALELKLKDELIEQYKDFKAKQSTKMLGESLEQHCLTSFNKIRMSAFPNAYFEKDNDAKAGSKGDFIFRESDEDGTEFISIMFEMKNEMETTSSKHKNEDFFQKLDKDRREKNCEYAVLVSLLEKENELYNEGIVDVSYLYPKMYVVRPQFFIPIISLLRNAALNSLKYQRELQIVKNQQLDIMNFEANLDDFKKGFSRNYELASRKFEDAINEIDKAISALQKTKEKLLSSNNNLRLANDKANDLSIKKLTKNAPSVKALFEEGKN